MRLYCLNVSSQSGLDKSLVEFYKKIFRVGSKNAEQILLNHPSLCNESLVLSDVQASADFLRSQAFEREELLNSPKVVLLNRQTCANRIQVLGECCFTAIRLSHLHHFVSLMNRNISALKTHQCIKEDTNVAENLVALLDLPVELAKDIDDSISLKATRRAIIGQYLIGKLGMKHQEVMSLWKTYPNLSNRSLKSIVNVLHVLERDIGFTKDKIIRNGFLIHSCGDNIKKILEEIPTIGDVPTKEVLLRNPKVLTSSVEMIKETIENIKSFKIPEDRILKCPGVLTLKPETVYARILELNKIKELKVLINDPGVLKLIYRHNKAKSRLEYLTQLKLRCVSLNVLSNSSQSFERYVKSGKDRTNGHELVRFLSEKFNQSEDELRNVLNRHPNWRYVSVISMKAVVDYLHYRGYSYTEMADNLHLLLYPLNRTDQKLKALVEWRTENTDRPNQAFSEVSNAQLLSLCLYFIEAEYHFTGNGVWDTDRHDGKQDITSISIPDFPDTLTKGQKYA